MVDEDPPNLAWALAAGEPDPDAAFRYGLDLLLAGLEQRLVGLGADRSAPHPR